MSAEKILMGYDNNGVVYDEGTHIIRKVADRYISKAAEIFEKYKSSDIKSTGIVETDFDSKNNVFIHKKHRITYPFEWTPNMFKDAILFHLNLFIELDNHGLTLKDALLNNIVFENTSPVFVDFLSIVKKNELKNEEWLNTAGMSDPRFAVLKQMFEPFIIIPFVAMAMKKYTLARKIMRNKACNCSDESPTWNDVINSEPSFLPLFQQLKIVIKRYLKKDKTWNLIARFHTLQHQPAFINGLQEINALIANEDLTPPTSGYDSYYETKGELLDFSNHDNWKEKQKNIHEILLKNKPGSVLDIGANTGWYSQLAESIGASVIAVEIDEACIDKLYLHSKKNKLKILPLKLSFDDFTKEIYGLHFNEKCYENRDFTKNPLYSAAVNRLQSDTVLVLALLHHLVLGEGKSLEYIFEVLAKITNKTLVLEFVDINDRLIKEEPGFFKNIKNYSASDYNIDIVTKTGLQHFRTYEILNSNPDTRKIIVLNK